MNLNFDKESNANYYAKLEKWCFENIDKKRKDWDGGMLYAFDVLFKPIYTTSKYMKLQAFKMLNYLYQSKTNADFLYFYDVENLLKLEKNWPIIFKLVTGKNKGAPFNLEKNQLFKLSGIFGFRDKKFKNKLLTKEFFDIEARKQGKSEFFAAVADFFCADPFELDAMAEIYFCGPKKESSDILFKKASTFIRYSEVLQPIFTKNNTIRISTHDKSIIKALPFEVDTLEGKNPSLVILTEYHLHPNDDMYHSASSARNESRWNYIIVFDTTKGHDINGVAYNREKRYKQNLVEQFDNPERVIMPEVFCFIAEIDDEDDWEDPQCWAKANPMLDITISLENLMQEYERVKGDNNELNEFKTKRLGMWVSGYNVLFSDSDLEESNERWKDVYKSPSEFEGKACYIAIDLAKSHDLNAISLIFKDKRDEQNENAIIIAKAFIPKDTIKERENQEGVSYMNWIKQGHIKVSGTKTVDYKDIAAYINELLRTYNVKKILYDPWQWASVEAILQGIYQIPEYLFENIPQTLKELSDPMNHGTKKIWDKNFYYFNNPLVKYQFLNVIPSETNGQIYFTKNKQVNRVDTFATYITAMSRWKELPAINEDTFRGPEIWITK